MERILIVRVGATVASFRRPLEHNYQRTFPLPPPTTLLGIAGAALGLSRRELWAQRSPLRQLKVSVLMECEPARARDTWTVLKIKAKKIVARSPYVRELLFFARYALLYSSSTEVLDALAQAFRDPAYPLSLGREDELATVEEIAWEEARAGEPVFWGTVLRGDIRQMETRLHNLQPGVRFELPIVETLPLRFLVGDDGVRHPELPTPLSFLPPGLQLRVEALTNSVLNCRGRNFVWLNS